MFNNLSNVLVVASRRSTAPALDAVFTSQVDAAFAVAVAGLSGVEVLPLNEAIQIFTANARADEQYVIDVSTLSV